MLLLLYGTLVVVNNQFHLLLVYLYLRLSVRHNLDVIFLEQVYMYHVDYQSFCTFLCESINAENLKCVRSEI